VSFSHLIKLFSFQKIFLTENFANGNVIISSVLHLLGMSDISIDIVTIVILKISIRESKNLLSQKIIRYVINPI